jgi:Zn-dependent membrane protease YugP
MPVAAGNIASPAGGCLNPKEVVSVFYFDSLYFILLIPALVLSLYASWKTRSAFKKYSKVRTLNGLTGAQAAQRLLDGAGITDVEIVPTRGTLSDHYNPMNKTLALSEPVYGSSSVAAVGIACHEAGHAIQHARNYKPLWLRSALVPTANLGSKLGYFVMFGGLLLMYMSGNVEFGRQVVLFGAVLFGAVLLFQIVTLPVEFDATARAKRLAVEHGIVLAQEREGMDKVLNAAALTYVAAVVSTLMTLLYYLLRAGLLGGRD